jgi:hypothetical protein
MRASGFRSRFRFSPWLVVIALLTIFGLGLVVSPSVRFYTAIPFDVLTSAQKREHLRNRTDHNLLLVECRELIDKHSGETIEAGDERLASIFDDIGTIYVDINDDYVIVALHGGFDHFGVYAFSEGVTGFGDEELADGLWYYSE